MYLGNIYISVFVITFSIKPLVKISLNVSVFNKILDIIIVTGLLRHKTFLNHQRAYVCCKFTFNQLQCQVVQCSHSWMTSLSNFNVIECQSL